MDLVPFAAELGPRRLGGEASFVDKQRQPQLALADRPAAPGHADGTLVSLADSRRGQPGVSEDLDAPKRRLKVRAETSKTRTMRILPISARLASVLEMARTDPAGHPFGPLDCVFGDEVGRKVDSTKRSWETAVLKAHGHAPKWEPGDKLSAASRARLKAIDLHFHDLRHEAGSRLIEAGYPVHHVQATLGHADLKQTTTYLNATLLGLEESMRGFVDDPRRRCKPVANEPATEHPPACNGDARCW